MPNSYFTLQEIQDASGDKINELLDIATGADPKTDQRLIDARDEANAEIDDNIRMHNTLPLTAVPESLRGYGIDLAVWKLVLKTRPDHAGQESVLFRKDDAMAYLEKHRDGVLSFAEPPESLKENRIDTTVVTLGSNTVTKAASDLASQQGYYGDW